MKKDIREIEDFMGAKEIVDEFFDTLDTIFEDREWTADDQLNADICEATDGQESLSHTG